MPLQRKPCKKSTRHLNHPLKTLAFITLTLTLFTTSCTKHLTTQSLRLDNNTRIILKDAWVLNHAPPLVQTLFIYEGADPNATYDFRANLHETPDGDDGPSSWIKQYPTPSSKNTNEIEAIWEFMTFPKESPKIYLRLYYHDKKTGKQTGTLEFVLPSVADLPVRKM